MRLPSFLTTLTSITTTTLALALPSTAPPLPTLTPTAYSGSACPSDGLTLSLGAPSTSPSNTTSSSAALTFTLSNFLPGFGSFGASLRMCNVAVLVSVEKGWRVRVNERGTTARGEADLPGNATMFFRDTWMVGGGVLEQSIGMLDVPGPLSGPFSRLVTPVEGNGKGVEGPCGGEDTEVNVEFQARAVNDSYGEGGVGGLGASVVDTAWSLTTDLEVLKC